jgi:hypothetical protein
LVDDKDVVTEGSQVISAYLSLQNPFVKGSKVTPEMLRVFKEELKKDNPTLGDSWIDSKVEIMKERGAEGRRYAPGLFPNISFPTDAMQRVIEAGGYDGFQDGGNHWVAFKPTQIKSATGSIGTFDETDADIAFNFERMASQPAAYVPEEGRTPSLRVGMNKLVRQFNEGKIAPETMMMRVENTLDFTKKEKKFKPRARGQYIIKKRINEEVGRGASLCTRPPPRRSVRGFRVLHTW